MQRVVHSLVASLKTYHVHVTTYTKAHKQHHYVVRSVQDADRVGDERAVDAATFALWDKLLTADQTQDASSPVDVLTKVRLFSIQCFMHKGRLKATVNRVLCGEYIIKRSPCNTVLHVLVVQVLPELSHNSATSLLLATHTCLDTQLNSLPPHLHPLAVHASFPSISAHSILELDCAAYTMSAVTAVFQTCAALPKGYQSLRLSSLLLDSSAPAAKNCVDSLQSALQAMPVEVSLQGAAVSHDLLSMILVALLQNRNLKTLELSSLRVTSVDTYPLDAVLAAGLAHMTSLKSLSLRDLRIENKPLRGGANKSLLIPALSSLTGLTSLDLGCGISDASDLCKIVSGMLQLLSLTLLFDATSKNSAGQLSSALCKLTLLNSLKLSEVTNSEGHPRVASSLASSLRGLMHMRNLDLAGCRMVDAGVLLLSSSVQHMSRLASLSLRTEKVSEGTLVALLSNLAVASSFTRLCIHVDELKHDGTGQLVYSKLSELSTLQVLGFNMACPPATGCESSSGSLASLTHLSNLSLSGCDFDRPSFLGSHWFLAALGSFSSLEALEMRDTVLGEQETKAFAAGVAVATCLRSLVMGSTSSTGLPYSHAQAMVIAPALGRLTQLTQLDLSGAFHNEGLEVMCHVLGKLTNLRKLDVCRNALDPDGAADLKLAVSSLVKLQYLDISSCSLSRTATASVTLGLATLVSLKHLDISGATINEKNVTHVVGSLQKLCALRSLSLQSVFSKCSSHKECAHSIAVLADGLCRLSNLTQLDLSSNSIGDDGANAVAKVLVSVRSLRSVALQSSRMSEAGAQTILAALSDSDPARCFELSQRCRHLVAMT